MSTQFIGEGNIGSDPIFKEFPNGNNEPRRLLRLNVRFDNPVPDKEGNYQDRGGFWAPVEIWHPETENWSKLYKKGMRVLVLGRRLTYGEWEDNEKNKRSGFTIEAKSVGILPHRINSLTLENKPDEEPMDSAAD